MEKIWLEHYPEGVPETVDPDMYKSLVEVLEKFTADYGEKPAFSNFGVEITYNELNKKSLQLAAYFQNELHLEKGDRIAIMSPNLLQYPVVIFAALRCGLVIVNVNPLYTDRELKFHLQDSGAKAIVIVENFAHTLEKAYKECPELKHILVTQIGDFLGGAKKIIINFVIKYVKRMVPAWNIPNTLNLLDALEKGAKLTFTPVELSGDDFAFLQYTGGTTGVPKGAELTHRNIIANIVQILALFIANPNFKLGEEVSLGALPMYHIFSLTVSTFCLLSLGYKVVLITNPRDIKHLIATLHKEPVTIFIGLNTLFNAILHHPDVGKANLDKVKLTIGGGTATTRDVSNRWEKFTSKPIIQGYGLTETSPIVSVNSFESKIFNGSVGVPLPSTDIKIVDDNGKELALGEKGELWVKGPQVMKGYWKKPEETAKVLFDGWLATGDIARVDENGNIYIVDRKKDMVIVSGFNVYPNEVEEVLAAHPKVNEVAVIGIPDAETGEAVKAFIVKEKGAELSEKELISFCRESLTGYKVPKHYEFVDVLPKTPVGKVLRRELRN